MIYLAKHQSELNEKQIMDDAENISEKLGDYAVLDPYHAVKKDAIRKRFLRQALFNARYDVFEFVNPFDDRVRGIAITTSSPLWKMNSPSIVFMTLHKSVEDMALLHVGEKYFDAMALCKADQVRHFTQFGFSIAMSTEPYTQEPLYYVRLTSKPYLEECLASIRPSLRHAVRIRRAEGSFLLVAGDFYVPLNEDAHRIAALFDGSRSIVDIANTIVSQKKIDHSRILPVKLRVLETITTLWHYGAFLDSTIDKEMMHILFYGEHIIVEPLFAQHETLEPRYITPVLDDKNVHSVADLLALLDGQCVCLSMMGSTGISKRQIVLFATPDPNTYFIYGCFGKEMCQKDWLKLIDFLETHEISQGIHMTKSCTHRAVSLLIYGEKGLLRTGAHTYMDFAFVGSISYELDDEDMPIFAIQISRSYRWLNKPDKT